MAHLPVSTPVGMVSPALLWVNSFRDSFSERREEEGRTKQTQGRRLSFVGTKFSAATVPRGRCPHQELAAGSGLGKLHSICGGCALCHPYLCRVPPQSVGLVLKDGCKDLLLSIGNCWVSSVRCLATGGASPPMGSNPSAGLSLIQVQC